MEELAMFGALVVSGGASSATAVPSEQLVLAQEQGKPLPEITALDRQASDEVFLAPPARHPPSLAFTALVVAAGTLALKATVLDEGHMLRDEEEDKEEEPSEGDESRADAR
jgi:hypothetical protein